MYIGIYVVCTCNNNITSNNDNLAIIPFEQDEIKDISGDKSEPGIVWHMHTDIETSISDILVNRPI